MEIGHIIKLKRKEMGWTQEELSSGICAVSYLSLIENSKMVANTEILSLLMDKLGVNEGYLITSDQKSIYNRLKDWYGAIRRRDIETSKKLEINFKKDYPKGFYEPNLQLHYLLVFLRHKILHTDFTGIDNMLDSLNKIKSFVNRANLIFYYHTVGYYEYECGNPNRSINLLNEAKRLSEILNLKEPDLLYHMALTYLKLQDAPNVLLAADLSLRDYQEEVNLTRIIDCNLLIGIAKRQIGNIQEARGIFENLLTYALSNEQEGKVLHNLGHVYYKLGEYENAIETLQMAIKVKKGQSSEALTNYLLGKVYIGKKDYDAAKKTLQSGVKLLKGRKNKSLTIKYKLMEYQIVDKVQSDKYINFLLDEALPYFEEFETDYAKEYLIKVAYYYENKRCYKEANHFLRRALKL